MAVPKHIIEFFDLPAGASLESARLTVEQRIEDIRREEDLLTKNHISRKPLKERREKFEGFLKELEIARLCDNALAALATHPPALEPAVADFCQAWKLWESLSKGQALTGPLAALKESFEGRINQLYNQAAAAQATTPKQALADLRTAQRVAAVSPDAKAWIEKLATLESKLAEDERFDLATNAASQGDVLAITALYQEHREYAPMWAGFLTDALRARLQQSSELAAQNPDRAGLEELRAKHLKIQAALAQVRKLERRLDPLKTINRCNEDNEDFLRELKERLSGPRLASAPDQAAPIETPPGEDQQTLERFRQAAQSQANQAWLPVHVESLKAYADQEPHRSLLTQHSDLRIEWAELLSAAETRTKQAADLMARAQALKSELTSQLGRGDRETAFLTLGSLKNLAENPQDPGFRADLGDLNAAIKSVFAAAWQEYHHPPRPIPWQLLAWLGGAAVIVGLLAKFQPWRPSDPSDRVTQPNTNSSVVVMQPKTNSPAPTSVPVVQLPPPPPVIRTGTLHIQSGSPLVEFAVAQNGQARTNGSLSNLNGISLTLSNGQYQVTLRRFGHAPMVTNLTVAAGQSVKLEGAFPEGYVDMKSVEHGVQFTMTKTGAAGATPLVWSGTTPTNALSLPAGDYQAVLRRSGYLTITQANISVLAGYGFLLPAQTWVKPSETPSPTPPTPPPPPPTTGAFKIVSIPPGASVKASLPIGKLEVPAGQTMTNLAPGTVPVTISLAGYVPVTTNVVVKPGFTLALTVHLEPVTGWLTVSSTPRPVNFQVLDGTKEAGRGRAGDAALSLRPGAYQIVFTHAWGTYLTAQVTNSFTVLGGQTNALQHSFDEGTVRFESDASGVRISLPGTLLPTETPPFELAFPPGAYQFTATSPKLTAKTKLVTVAKSGTQTVRFDFLGRAVIRTTPPGAEIRVNGLATGDRTPVSQLELPEGRHEIELRLAGHVSVQTNLNIIAGQSANQTLASVALSPIRQYLPPSVNVLRWTNSLGMSFARVPVQGGSVLFGIHEARVQDFELFAKDTTLDWTPSGPANHPAVEVTWRMAGGFCEWLTKKEQAGGRLTGRQRYRLPTDREWSTAVGLGPEAGLTPLDRIKNAPADEGPWGRFNPQVAFKPPPGAGNYGPAAGTDAWDGTSPVGTFKPNQFGLYDLGGNAWEWCADLVGSASDIWVLRGGSWNTVPQKGADPMYSFRSGVRFPGAIKGNDTGFRPVLDLDK